MDNDSIEIAEDATATSTVNGKGAIISLSEWHEKGSMITGESKTDKFGDSVALSEDGKILAIGTSLNDGNGTDSGHVRVFEWKEYTEDMSGSYHYETRNVNTTQEKPLIISTAVLSNQVQLVKKIRIEVNEDLISGISNEAVYQRCLNIANVEVIDQQNENVIQNQPMQIYIDTDSYLSLIHI